MFVQMISSKPPKHFVSKLGIVLHYYESECHAKRLICYFQGQGHCKSSYDQNMTITTVAFMWVPEHVGILGNEAADRAAEEALEKEPICDLMPF